MMGRQPNCCFTFLSRAKARIQKEKQDKHYVAQTAVLVQDLQKRLRVSIILTCLVVYFLPLKVAI